MDIVNNDKSTLSDNKNFLVPGIMYNVIITEKPSVAREYVKALKLQQSGNNDGYIEGHSSVTNEDYRITWSVGHLVTLSYPQKYDEKYKKWNMGDLPFLPNNYLYEVIQNVKKQYQVVKSVYHMSDISRIYYAGDSGREGIYIQALIRQEAGHKTGIEEKVVWIDSQTESEILKGIKNAKPISEYSDMINSAYMRAIEDYAMGINFSRVLSCKFGYSFNKSLNTDKYKPISVGRVMTCVLGMIVRREKEISNFVETVYYKPNALCGDFTASWKAIENTKWFNNPKVYNNIGFLSFNKVNEFIDGLKKILKLFVEKVEQKNESKNAPLLYNLAEIQNDCTKLFKISPDETLGYIQSLYEEKFVTYPRTDARYLTSAVASEIETNLKGIQYKPECVKYILDNKRYVGLEKSKYVDDSKVTDHYAIIPTGEGNPNSLSGIKKDIYELIVRRFLAIFYPPAEYKKIEVTLKHDDNEYFFASEKILKVLGYLEIEGNEEVKEDGALATIKQGAYINADFSVTEGKTQPPKRYTSGSMILAMENAGNLIEDEDLRAQIKSCGIGTSATRAEIIKKLVTLEHISLNKKTQVLTPAAAGYKVYDIVNQYMNKLLSPEMTASWEKGLDQIAQGSISKEKYQETLNSYIRSNVELVINAKADNFTSEETDLVCPYCGSNIVTTQNGFKCENYKKDTGCSFYISTIAGVQITKDILRELLENGKTQVIDHFVGKSKNKFAAALILNKEEKKIDFEFADNEEVIGVCPYCGGDIVTTGNFYKCRNYSKEEDGCKFFVSSIAGVKISRKDVKTLLQDGHTGIIRGFTSKSGKKFDASLKIENRKIVFDMQNSEEVIGTCPYCGGEVIYSGSICKCRNYSKEEDGCKFFVSSIAGVKISVKEVTKLIKDGKTGLIKGFISKKGSKFEASLKIEDNKIVFDFPPRK